MSDREFKFTRHDFEQLRTLVGKHTGISLSDHKQEMLYSRLSRRLRALNLNSFASYYKFLENDNGEELAQFINAVTTNLTAFFREAHHFSLLEQEILPEFIARKHSSRRLRIWSAGCATGEEPYSIAMVLKEIMPSDWDVKILATDVDSSVLFKAKEGIYEEDKLTSISPVRVRRWFKRGVGAYSGKAYISPELQEIVTFKHLNLIHPWPMHGPIDIIFCRNVVIYFNKQTQKILFDRFANLLDNDGFLFVGHSENLFQITNRFRLLQQTVYVKC